MREGVDVYVGGKVFGNVRTEGEVLNGRVGGSVYVIDEGEAAVDEARVGGAVRYRD